MLAVIRLVAGALLITCALSPLAYELVLALWSEPVPPFRRVFDRVGMLALLIMAVVERKNLGLGHVRAILASERAGGGARSFGRGLVLSLACGAAAAPLIFARPDVARSAIATSALAWRSFTDLPGAFVVGVVEECFFRAIVLEALRRSLGAPLALGLSTLFYASVHFLRPDKSFAYELSPFVGARYLAAVVDRALTLDFAWPFVGLVFVGLALGVVYLRTRSLWLCIGMHAGWFLVHKMAVRGLRVTSMEQIFGEPSWHLLTMGWTWASIAATGVLALVTHRRRRGGVPAQAPSPPVAEAAAQPGETRSASRALPRV